MAFVIIEIMKLDILAIAAHPDDVELCCSGTILKHIAKGDKVGLIDLTKGELGTRGTPEIREEEAKVASELLGLEVRENLGMRDGFIKNDEEHQLQLISAIRKYRPEIVLANAENDRHPDHIRASQLETESCFLSGLKMIKTYDDYGAEQEPWRPKAVYYYVQSYYAVPDIVVDISEYWEKKEQVVKAFKSQFYDPNSNEPSTFISSPRFMKFLEARAREYGHVINAEYGEGYTVKRTIGVNYLSNLL